jgi:sugar/nucleoside kinase (ribokinase family)
MFQLDGRMLAGQMKRVSGGVGRNIADALGRFGHDVCFLSAVGDDSNGDAIIKSLDHIVSIHFFIRAVISYAFFIPSIPFL